MFPGRRDLAAVRGDWNYDGHVGLADILAYPPCISGPMNDFAWMAPSANCVDNDDFDGDADIDLADLAALQASFTGGA